MKEATYPVLVRDKLGNRTILWTTEWGRACGVAVKLANAPTVLYTITSPMDDLAGPSHVVFRGGSRLKVYN